MDARQKILIEKLDVRAGFCRNPLSLLGLAISRKIEICQNSFRAHLPCLARVDHGPDTRVLENLIRHNWGAIAP
jgi:hypothetical protein